jgi:hypothetical protein
MHDDLHLAYNFFHHGQNTYRDFHVVEELFKRHGYESDVIFIYNADNKHINNR